MRSFGYHYFDQTRIAKEIIRGAGVHVPEYLSERNDELHKLLCESVKKKRFLLVLDDMWTDDNTKWEPFRLSFKNAAQGSRILVTTRLIQITATPLIGDILLGTFKSSSFSGEKMPINYVTKLG
ncbi:disease resistance protein RGA2-like [Papaver somniferum]|uniref:disease resistance protein RGA2-like n=1 Tax=Papaver somniferum TaxID=3469 RepID=UPI000E6FBB86|nr:disease resistance protein RGA2-like [Papaver somniferum]